MAGRGRISQGWQKEWVEARTHHRGGFHGPLPQKGLNATSNFPVWGRNIAPNPYHCSPQEVHSFQDAWEHGLLSAWGFLSGRQLWRLPTLSSSICFHTLLHRWCCCRNLRVQTYTQMLEVLMQGQGSHSQAKQNVASSITVYKSRGCVYGGQKGLAQDFRYSSKGQEPAATGSNLHLRPQLHVKCNSNH